MMPTELIHERLQQWFSCECCIATTQTYYTLPVGKK